MFSPEWVVVVPFLLVGVFWVLIDDEEFDRRFKEWAESDESDNEENR